MEEDFAIEYLHPIQLYPAIPVPSPSCQSFGSGVIAGYEYTRLALQDKMILFSLIYYFSQHDNKVTLLFFYKKV